jgi:hypothetical protein
MDGIFQLEWNNSGTEQLNLEIVNAMGQVIDRLQFGRDERPFQFRISATGVYNVRIFPLGGALIEKRVVVLR